jgi:hypothetical protein
MLPKVPAPSEDGMVGWKPTPHGECRCLNGGRLPGSPISPEDGRVGESWRRTSSGGTPPLHRRPAPEGP